MYVVCHQRSSPYTFFNNIVFSPVMKYPAIFVSVSGHLVPSGLLSVLCLFPVLLIPTKNEF